jgi:hypothetical protein
VTADFLVWREMVEGYATHNFTRFLIHYKPTPAYLEPKYADTVRSTLQEMCAFLHSADFQGLLGDALGGKDCVDVYLVAPDEKKAFDLAGYDQASYLRGRFGYEQPTSEIQQTTDNRYPYFTYLVLDSGAPPNSNCGTLLKDATDARLTVVHELFHSLQSATNAHCSPWFVESTAVAAQYLFELYYAVLREPAWPRLFQYAKHFLRSPSAYLGADDDVYGPGVFVLFWLQRHADRLPARLLLQHLVAAAQQLARANEALGQLHWSAEHALRVVAAGPDARYADPTLPTLADLLLDFHAANAADVLRNRGGAPPPRSESAWRIPAVGALVTSFLQSELERCLCTTGWTGTTAYTAILACELAKVLLPTSIQTGYCARLYYVTDANALEPGVLYLSRSTSFGVRGVARLADGSVCTWSEGAVPATPLAELIVVVVSTVQNQ